MGVYANDAHGSIAQGWRLAATATDRNYSVGILAG